MTPELRELCKPYTDVVLREQAVIQERMYHLKDEAAQQLIKVTAGKQNQRAYYPEPEHDSLFFDQKR